MRSPISNGSRTTSLPASTRKGKKRATIRPVCLGSLLVVMYIVFLSLILSLFDEEDHAEPLLDPKPSSADSLSHEDEGKGEKRQQSVDGRSSSRSGADDNVIRSFCGKCIWKDSPYSCDTRVKWEMENRGVSELTAKRNNLSHCLQPHEAHVADFCGDCAWKGNMPFTCDERVQWEIAHRNSIELDAKKRNLKYCKKPPYILSNLCGGCAKSKELNMTSKKYREGTPCWEIMTRRMNKGAVATTEDAGRLVANEFPACKLCHPDNCWREYFDEAQLSDRINEGDARDNLGYHTKYWRFDQSAPEFRNPTTLVLPSIPDELRLPTHRVKDIEAYLTEIYHDFESRNDTDHVPMLIEYNPGLAQIPPQMKAKLPSNAAYLVALRVTPANNCFRRDQMQSLDQKVWDHTMMSATNLLGLALLDEKYEILPGYDIIVDIASQLELQRDGYGTTYFGEPTFMDYRLFTLNGEVYLHANADITVVTKLDIMSKEHFDKKTANNGKYCKKENGTWWRGDKNGDESPCTIDVVHGEDNLVVRMKHNFNAIWSGGDRGKNFALFSVPNATHPDELESTYAEVDINPIHRVQQLNLDAIDKLPRYIVKKRIRRNYAVDVIMMRQALAYGNVTDSDEAPPRSFYTIDEHWFPETGAFREAGHGGACCVSFTKEEVLAQGEHIYLTPEIWGEENDYLLMGVAHTSVTWKHWYSDPSREAEKAMLPHTHYISFFYAFEPRPPFNIRARSGYFCLGFAAEDGSEKGPFNQHSTLTFNRKLSQHNETFSCPQIHFVSSFVEKVGDPSTTVIGYGINDCTPRIIEVTKKEVARMIFSDPWEMKIESGHRAKD
mmetsp:Transcript_7088/g.16422  ORF Transcript_7088/g.16422 Transcript_7088/m.16422 type:complete len:836 (-) Transcript_7088:61-2568(-)